MCKLFVAAVSLTLILGACSADSTGVSERRGTTTPSGASGAAGPSTGTQTTTQGAIDNPSSVPAPTTPAPSAGAASPRPRQRTKNTEITREPIAIDDCSANNPAGLSAAEVQRLKAGSGSAGELRWLYPYQGTVFPRGMLAPDLMWDGPPADVLFIHIKSKIFEYSACVTPTESGRFTLPQDVWDKAGQRSFGKDDDYLVELTLSSLGRVIGPAPLHIQIAQAAIKGSIYYNTYRSNLVSGGPASGMPAGGAPNLGGFPTGGVGIGGSNGIVVRIPAAGRAEVFGRTDCNGCHSVSADGSTLLAQSVLSGAMSYELVANGPPPMPTSAGSNGTWVGLYPDGSAALSMSTVIDVARSAIFGGFGGGSGNATLFDTKTGQTIPSTGIPAGVLMPFFSPDGTFLVFNDFAIEDAHGIALMRYDTKTHTASDYNVLVKEPPGGMRPAWPFVLPDNGGVVFVRTDDFDFTGGGVGVSGDVAPGAIAPFAELSIIDVASKKVTLLAKAMGYDTPEAAAAAKTYLPFGPEDLHHAYYPTVSPVGSGGYFWVFFDSIRHYGVFGLQRQLWGAAIEISHDGTYTRDPSHPAFYVSGQEFGTGNHRAFAALDPCRKDGDACTSGIDCCGGFCSIQSAAELVEPVGTCSPDKMECSNKDERCTTEVDCCLPPEGQMPYSCIAGFCAYVTGPS